MSNLLPATDVIEIGPGWKGPVTKENIDAIAAYILKLLDGKTFSHAINMPGHIEPELNTCLHLNRTKVEVNKWPQVTGNPGINVLMRKLDGYSYVSCWIINSPEDVIIGFGHNSFSVVCRRISGVWGETFAIHTP